MARTDVVTLFRKAQETRSDADIEALSEHLADDVAFTVPMRGTTTGKDAVLGNIKNPPQRMGGGGGGGGGMGQLQWSDPVEEGDTVVTAAEIPPGAPIPIKGLKMVFTFGSDDKVKGIEMQPQM